MVMQFLRTNMKAIFIITILGFVVATFAGFGGYYISQKHNTVAKINGAKIFAEDLENASNRMIRQTESQTGKALTPEEVSRARKESLQMLMQESLLLGVSKKIGFDVSDTEIMSAISNFPAFKKDGRFDSRTYYYTLRYHLHQTAQDFEDKVKDSIMGDKIKLLITDSVKVSPKEIQDAYYQMANGNMRNFNQERESFAQKYMSQKKMLILNSWFSQLSQTAKITVTYKE
ncbi:MAG: SurA N-terminal domain-containing protein [Elusimicrobiota bacterium]